MSIKTIEQGIIATNDFDGTAPAGDVVLGNDLEKYAPEAAGGLFDFGVTDPSEIYHVELKLGGQSAWTLHKKDIDGIELLLWSGATETDFATLAEDRMPILQGQTLLLRTTGATAALKARISVRRLR